MAVEFRYNGERANFTFNSEADYSGAYFSGYGYHTGRYGFQLELHKDDQEPPILAILDEKDAEEMALGILLVIKNRREKNGS